MRLKLFTKTVLLLTSLAVIPAAVVGWRTITINREGMQAAILELHTYNASHLAEEVQNYLKSFEREIQYILRTLSTQMTWNDRQSVLQALMDTNENFASVAIVSDEGQELLKAYNPLLEKAPRLLVRSGDETFKRFWTNPKISSLSGVYFLENSPRMNIIYPLGPRHCLYTTVTLDKLWNEIAATRVASTGYAFLVNEKGEVIAHPAPENSPSSTSAAELPIVAQALKAVTVGSSEYVHPATGKRIVGAYAPVKGLNWGVIIQQDKDEAYVSVYRMQRQAAVLILISVAAAAFLAVFAARGLTRPVVRITEAARLVARKDFSPRVEVRSRDELQDLAETFNDMTTELGRYDRMQVDKIMEEKTKTEAVIFSIDDAIIMTDGEKRLQLANRHAREILGLPDTGWENTLIGNYLAHPGLSQALEEVFRNEKETADRKEFAISLGSLSRYYQLSAGEVITQDKKEKIGFVMVLRNVTLQKELDTMKDEFLHAITHDLRNPMTSIRGFLKFLLDGVGGPLTSQQRSMLETMDRASLRLLVLINDILDIAKLESGRMDLTLTETDLPSVAKKNIEIAQGIALKKSITLSLEGTDILPKITCDSELIDRVFSNLISNALKFTPESGRVTLRIAEQPDAFEVSVTDTGEGIPAEYLQKIFDKFQQVAGQRRSGTGLGLAICKYIVEAHLGRIWAESKLGEGSRFVFTLPRNLTADRVMKASIERNGNA